MIFSRLNGKDDLSVYPAAVRRALEFLRTADLLEMDPGSYPLEGERMFVNLMDMTTRPPEDSHPEIHQKYVDLMYWPEGGERIGVANYLGTEAVYEANPEKDIAFLEEVHNESFLTALPGCFALFFPWDAHRPALMLGDTPATSRKCVVKISMELLKEKSEKQGDTK